VLVTRRLSHGWLEEVTMHVLRTRLLATLCRADAHGRFHAYYPHVDGLAEGTCIDVHSKLMIVDDEWLRIGSANLSNRSMGVDTECDLVVEARGDARVRAAVQGLRDRLLAEHLGVPAGHFASVHAGAGSLSAAIASLPSPARTLRLLEEADEWSDASLSAAAIADLEQPVSLDRLVGHFAPDPKLRHALPGWDRVAGVLIVLAGLTALWRFTPLADVAYAERIRGWIAATGDAWWAPIAVVAAYTPASIVMFPRPLITVAAVAAFGPWLGFTYAMAGILIAAWLSYHAGRRMRRSTVRRLGGERLHRLSRALRARGLLAVVLIRLVPVAPFVIEGIVAGAIRIPWWHFMAGTFLGMLPGVVAATVLGGVLEAALHDPGRIDGRVLGAALVVLVVFFATLCAVRRAAKDKADAPRGSEPRAPS
jgi:uncharacterized membrane protein YdjX (TVP38/TMEM64 family)